MKNFAEFMKIRTEELIKKYPPGNLDFECNCHGASLYALGIISECGWYSFNKWKEKIGRCLKIQNDNLSEGDIALFKNQLGECLHSGVITLADKINPFIFSKHKNFWCDNIGLSQIQQEYGNNVSYLRLISVKR